VCERCEIERLTGRTPEGAYSRCIDETGSVGHVEPRAQGSPGGKRSMDGWLPLPPLSAAPRLL